MSMEYYIIKSCEYMLSACEKNKCFSWANGVKKNCENEKRKQNECQIFVSNMNKAAWIVYSF